MGAISYVQESDNNIYEPRVIRIAGEKEHDRDGYVREAGIVGKQGETITKYGTTCTLYMLATSIR